MKKNLVGVAIFLLLLVAIGIFAASKYSATLNRTKEVVLQQNLWAMRRAIEFYARDRGTTPKLLEDLMTSGYLREIPADPFTGSSKTWIIQKQSEQNSELGITGIQSGAPGTDRSGKPYRQY